MNRRTYIKQVALFGGALTLAPRFLISCTNDESYVSDYSIEPFKTLDEIRHALRQSPGHLKQEMMSVIEQKDANAIFNFIQNRITTIPPAATTITSNAYEIRWGKEAMLRCGKGTLREKSDLLYEMLEQAGYKPTYYRYSFKMTPQKVASTFCGVSKDNDLIVTSEDQINNWSEKLDTTKATSSLRSVNLDDSLLKAQSKVLLSKLPPSYRQEMAYADWLNVDSIEAPVVKIEQDGKSKLLHFVDNSDSIELDTGLLFDLELEAIQQPYKNVRIIIKGTYSDAINEPLELVRGEWPIEHVIGNQIALDFVSPIPQEQLLVTSFEDVKQFVPVLGLKNVNKVSKSMKAYYFKGVGFDLFGNTFQEDGDGAIRMNGLKMNDATKTDTSEIKELKVKLLDFQYPVITLQCAPLDADGNIVKELSGSSFRVVDQNKLQLPVIKQNTSTSKVLVFFDNTASMPYPYSYGEVPKELVDAVEQTFSKQFNNVIVDIASYGLDFLTVLESQTERAYTHIVCIGDGEGFENNNAEKILEMIGDTTISYHYILNESNNQSDTLVRACFSLPSMSFFEGESFNQHLESVLQMHKNRIVYPYELTYEAPFEDDNLIHDVQVTIGNNSEVVPVTKRYIVNRERIYKDVRKLCGLSMTLEWEDGYDLKSTTKTLVGYSVIEDTEILPNHYSEIHQFCLGNHRLYFEADKPTMPVLLDDIITSQLSAAPVFQNSLNSQEKQLKELNGLKVLSATPLSVFAPLPKNEPYAISFQNAFQTCLFSEYINFEKKESTKKIDFWPTTDVRSLAKTVEDAFKRNLESTLALAKGEAIFRSQNTWQLLQDKPLKRFKYGTIDYRVHPEHYKLEAKAYLNYLLYDDSGSTGAYWQINKSTGAVLGILPDGSGGGIETAIIHNLKIIDSYAAAYNKAAAPLMSDPLAFGTVTMYGQFLARLYGLVCVALIAMDASELPVKSRQAIKKMAYGVIKSFAFAKFGALKNFEKILDKLFDPGWPDIN